MCHWFNVLKIRATEQGFNSLEVRAAIGSNKTNLI
jgi:hypothetical protein